MRAHGSWLVVHGGCDLAGRCSSDVRVLEVERTATTLKAPHGGAGGALGGAGGDSGALRGAGSAFGDVNASLSARWLAVRVDGAAPRPRAFHVAIALDFLPDSPRDGGGGSTGGGGGNGGGNGGGERVLLLGGCAPILGAAGTSAAATPLWVGGAAPAPKHNPNPNPYPNPNCEPDQVGGAGVDEECMADEWLLELGGGDHKRRLRELGVKPPTAAVSPSPTQTPKRAPRAAATAEATKARRCRRRRRRRRRWNVPLAACTVGAHSLSHRRRRPMLHAGRTRAARRVRVWTAGAAPSATCPSASRGAGTVPRRARYVPLRAWLGVGGGSSGRARRGHDLRTRRAPPQWRRRRRRRRRRRCERAVCARFGCTNPSRCTAPEVCSCADGWQGFDCGVRSSGGATLWSLLLGADPAHLAPAPRAHGGGGDDGGGGGGGGGGGAGAGPADAAAAAARLAFLEPVLKPAVAAAGCAPLHRGWGAAGAAGVAGAEWRDAARWRDEARARGWAAWRGCPAALVAGGDRMHLSPHPHLPHLPP